MTSPPNGPDSAVKPASPPAPQTRTSTADNDGINPLDFQGNVDSNNDLPTPDLIREIDNYVVLDKDRKSHTFRSLYTGKHAARRVLVIFVRHFFCGNCQQYLRSLLKSNITPSTLLSLPLSTHIVVVGCGQPDLIPSYTEALLLDDGTPFPFPIYTDPTGKLYAALGMIRSLALGDVAPAYMEHGILKSSVKSIWQGVKQIPKGNVLKAGDQRQIGGEFLFEPIVASDRGDGSASGAGIIAEAAASPIPSPPGEGSPWGGGLATAAATATSALEKGDGATKKMSSDSSLDGKNEDGPGALGEDKAVTWCHRMRNTRDHAEIPELREVLGLAGHGAPAQDAARWERAVKERKGKGKSLAEQMRAMEDAVKAEGGGGTA